ncbi:hypothetical protein K435DRAFT_870468 [Dendrothele bispora CBS 962.96]|uniref:F-box domain-containing protein n=1 Tax=Dendrothele bispora (strain CBS 962.96) TaxID=1314807 RepID=A0A4S8L6K6_DENBC|nr:hypothetical protein K435DRAFT_870468 [Dendrothele bispora CBS 962.96]
MTTTTCGTFEDLPDELLQEVIEFLNLFQTHPITIQDCPSPASSRLLDLDLYPVDSMSLVNRRFRRLSLPILFREINIVAFLRRANDREQFHRLMEVLKLNTHLMSLIRNVKIIYTGLDSRRPMDLEAQLIVDVLSRFTRLERLDLPSLIKLGHQNQRPMIEALNSHPSDTIRLQFMSTEEQSFDYLDFDHLRSISLSRVVCRDWYIESCSDQGMKTWLAQGLNIKRMSRSGMRSVDDNWMDGTYPGLTLIYSWNGNQRSLQSTIDFLLRHPLLNIIELDRAHECDTTPWRVTFASKMYPYSFKIVKRDIGWPQENNVVEIDGEWLYNDVKVIFQDDIAHGDVETVETMIRTLSEALPQSSDCLELALCVGIDFLSPVGKYMTSDDLISILARNMNYADALDLGKFVGDILIRECSQILELDPAGVERFIPGFEPFCKRLKQVMPRLRQVCGQNPQGWPSVQYW